MRRRWRAMLEDGSLAGLRSEGRLAALYVLYAADFSTCQVRMSVRRAAKFIGVHPTTMRRGIAQMIAHGILEVLEKSEGSGRSVFVVAARAQCVSAPDTSGVQVCAPLVSTPDTSRARSEHEPCAERTRVVRAARTLCARNSFRSIGSSITTNGISNQDSSGAGQEPAPSNPKG
jgi:transposase-like protein